MDHCRSGTKVWVHCLGTLSSDEKGGGRGIRAGFKAAGAACLSFKAGGCCGHAVLYLYVLELDGQMSIVMVLGACLLGMSRRDFVTRELGKSCLCGD